MLASAVSVQHGIAERARGPGDGCPQYTSMGAFAAVQRSVRDQRDVHETRKHVG